MSVQELQRKQTEECINIIEDFKHPEIDGFNKYFGNVLISLNL